MASGCLLAVGGLAVLAAVDVTHASDSVGSWHANRCAANRSRVGAAHGFAHAQGWLPPCATPHGGIEYFAIPAGTQWRRVTVPEQAQLPGHQDLDGLIYRHCIDWTRCTSPSARIDRLFVLTGPAGGCLGGRPRLERRSGASRVTIRCRVRPAGGQTFGLASPLAGLVRPVFGQGIHFIVSPGLNVGAECWRG